MTHEPRSTLPEGTQPAPSLKGVLSDNEHAWGMVKESAEELASVNQVLSDGLSDGISPHEMGSALAKSEAVEVKVQDASEKLSQVNLALENEVQERHLLEQELARVTEQQQQAHHASLHDALTGLPNRVLFNDRLEHGIEQAKRQGWTLAVMFLDLDQFKVINDTHGHDVGDAVLLSIAQRLTDTTRTDDTISRHGGDEFLYLLMDVNDRQDAAIVAEKIIQAVHLPCVTSAGELSVSTSVGIALYPTHGNTAAALIAHADAAMYQAKQTQSGYAFARDLPKPPSESASAPPPTAG